MSDSNQNNLIKRAINFLKQQVDLYGPFSVDISVDYEDAASEEELTQQKPVVVKDTPKAEETAPLAQEIAPTIELTAQEKLANCNTLEELHTLCNSATELKTDLANTNLVFGVGNPNADLMVIGEAPGSNEDRLGEPFVGQAGQLLDKILKAIDFERSDVYIANILKHRPPDNRDPKPEERERSLPYLLRQIEIINPKIILCVGRISGTTLLGKDSSLKDMRQKIHSFNGRELMVTYHPAALLRNQQWKRPTWEDVQLLRKRYDELQTSQ